mmetsp:Transcript_60599/g.100623  ORF Transcript_60599/g.100623 Transcript_60599/m.100623 type:complete len:80 (+) Transcript_60599:54-293(+)
MLRNSSKQYSPSLRLPALAAAKGEAFQLAIKSAVQLHVATETTCAPPTRSCMLVCTCVCKCVSAFGSIQITLVLPPFEY